MKPHQVAIVFGDRRCQIIEPQFSCDSAQELEGVDVTAHEGLETLTVSKLDKQLAAATFHQAEGIELARVTLVEKCPEATPVDLEPFPRRRLHATISTRGGSLTPDRV